MELQPPVPVHVASPPPTHLKHYQKGDFSRSKTQLPTETLEKAGQKKRHAWSQGGWSWDSGVLRSYKPCLPTRCPPSASPAASVLRGSMRTATGSVCLQRNAHATMQGCPILVVLSSIQTVRPGRS